MYEPHTYACKKADVEARYSQSVVVEEYELDIQASFHPKEFQGLKGVQPIRQRQEYIPGSEAFSGDKENGGSNVLCGRDASHV